MAATKQSVLGIRSRRWVQSIKGSARMSIDEKGDGRAGGFDDVMARLEALQQSIDTPPLVPESKPARESKPAGESKPVREPKPVRESKPVPAAVTMLKTRVERLLRRVVQSGAAVRDRVAELAQKVTPRALKLSAGLLLLVITVGFVLVRVAGTIVSGDGTNDSAAVEGPTESEVVVIEFPDAPPGTVSVLPEEQIQRPVGVRSVALGLEGAIVGVPELPECRAVTDQPDRVRWFDPPVDGVEDRPAVAPGRHGVALLVAGTDSSGEDGVFAGLEQAEVGQLIEVARANGTVLNWTVVDVVELAAGAMFPDGLLTATEDQRLVLVGCGDVSALDAMDVYVLARRTR